MDIFIDKETRKTAPNIRQNDDGMMDLGSRQTSDEAARQSELHARVEARRVPLSERLEGTTGVSSTASFVEEPRIKETIPSRSKSTAAPTEGHLRLAAQHGDTIELDAKAEERNPAAQVSPRI
jgi:hypothetical protein